MTTNEETALRPGQIVHASDGMSAWEAAEVVSGPHAQLTTEPGLYLIRFVEGGDEFLAPPDEIRA